VGEPVFGRRYAAGRGVRWTASAVALIAAAGGLAAGSHALLAESLRQAAGSAASALQSGGSPARSGAQESKRAVAAALLSVVAAIAGIELVLSAIRIVRDDASAAPHWSVLIAVPILWAIRAAMDAPGRRRAHEAYLSAAALLGAAAASGSDRWGEPMLAMMDEAAGCAVGAAMALQSFRSALRALGNGVQSGVGEAQLAAMRAAVRGVDGVIEVESCQTREHGHYVVVNLTIRVNPFITVYEGQEIGRRARERLLAAFPYVLDARVKVEPYDRGYPYKIQGDARQDNVPTLLQ
jgi:Predicted Co/Zn/Cd cation transporters